MASADALRAVEAEADAESDADAGHVRTFTLSTELGEAEIAVPPPMKWRSSARHALLGRGDDYTWARITLSPEDLKRWVECDPDGEETGEFIGEVMQAYGENLPNPQPHRVPPSPRGSGRGRPAAVLPGGVR